MKGVELYGRVRHAAQIDGLSRREAARRFGIDPPTVRRSLAVCSARRTAAGPTTRLYTRAHHRAVVRPLF